MRILKLTLLLLIITTNYIFCQNQNDSLLVIKRYLLLKDYQIQFYNEPLTKNDSSNFLYRGNDTLVLLKNNRIPKGTIVPYEYKDSTFLNYYEKIAFNHANDSISLKTYMKYWKDEIKIFFSKSVSKKTKKDLMNFAKTIDKAVDSLRISEVKNLEDSNYIIYYNGDYEYESRFIFNKSNDYSWWKQNKIYRYALKLDPESLFSEHLIQYKLRESFIKSLGFFKLINDFDCESYFSNCYSPNKKLTVLDIEILRYHYSYGICKGTNLETFQNQHKNAKDLYKKTGHLIHFIHQESD
jgi:hypothetical protein